ncbi:MAG: hypothetical protein CME68_08955 [Halobacteriovoraceae bacterium]|nr:hypothetical protein [Halobacteriovoraceae bacterium]|tara:strand:+ start:933 stop:1841 length:909 start_codon:yes stop_codon:yes gene_type:complete
MKRFLLPKLIVRLTLLVFLVSSCGPELERKREGDSSSGQTSEVPSGGNGNCEGCNNEVPSSELDPSCLTEGVSHGVQVNVGGSWSTIEDPEQVRSSYLRSLHDFSLVLRGKASGANEVWSSENVSCLKERFKSDSVLQVRFLVYKRPTDNTIKDANGVICSNQDSKYFFTKMRLKVSLYGVDNNNPGVRKFVKQYDVPVTQGEAINVGSCSSILSLEVPKDSDRFVLSIDNIYWDFFCENKDVYGSNATTVCPDYHLPSAQCVKVGVQVATDSTLKLQWDSGTPIPQLNTGSSSYSNEQCPP